MSQASLLILDDDPQICRLLQAVFDARGINAEALKEPKCPLDRLQQHAYDVVLLDVVMPEISGIEVLEQIRDTCPETKVIMMTGYADKAMAIEALRAGAFDFLEKPIEIDVLSHAVSRALETQAIARAHQQTLEALRHSQEALRHSQEALRHSQEALRHSQEALRVHANDLEQLNAELRETHQAMLVLARNADRARQEMEERMVMHLRSLILPLVEDMRQDDRLEPYSSQLVMLGKAIEDAVAGLSAHLSSLPMLSAREMRIAMMIKNGMTTEDVADNLNISPETVKTHRRNIRKKLGLIGTGDQLRAYFRALEAEGKMIEIL
jgi:FixJ family two-component response regulator